MQTTQLNLASLVVSITIFLLFLIVIIITITYLYQKKQVIHFQNIQQLTMQYQNSLLSARIDTQEETLSHVAREIHDNIGQKLTLAKLTINCEIQDLTAASDLIVAQQLIGESILELSELTRLLNKDAVLANGLIQALEYEISIIKRITDLRIKLTITGCTESILGKDIQLALYRISQEALSNVLKHSKATTAEIFLVFNPCDVQMIITDDGCGIDLLTIGNRKKLGSGLNNMKNRTEEIAGEFQIKSLETKGTTINIKIPINYEQFNKNFSS